jgi:hypothetical protein
MRLWLAFGERQYAPVRTVTVAVTVTVTVVTQPWWPVRVYARPARPKPEQSIHTVDPTGSEDRTADAAALMVHWISRVSQCPAAPSGFVAVAQERPRTA